MRLCVSTLLTTCFFLSLFTASVAAQPVTLNDNGRAMLTVPSRIALTPRGQWTVSTHDLGPVPSSEVLTSRPSALRLTISPEELTAVEADAQIVRPIAVMLSSAGVYSVKCEQHPVPIARVRELLNEIELKIQYPSTPSDDPSQRSILVQVPEQIVFDHQTREMSLRFTTIGPIDRSHGEQVIPNDVPVTSRFADGRQLPGIYLQNNSNTVVGSLNSPVPSHVQRQPDGTYIINRVSVSRSLHGGGFEPGYCSETPMLTRVKVLRDPPGNLYDSDKQALDIIGWNIDLGAEPLAPGAPALISPLDSEQLTSLTPTLSWEGDSTISQVNVSVYRELPADTWQYVLEEVELPPATTQVQLPTGTLLANVEYLWYVSFQSDAGFSFSQTRRFRTPGNACRADFNGMGGVTLQDLFDFLSVWFALDLAADFNMVGGVTPQDLFDFLSAWFAGC